MCRRATAYELIHFSLNFTLDIFANVILHLLNCSVMIQNNLAWEI